MSRTITAIKPQKGTRRRLNIFLDGVFAFSLDALVAAERGLCPGMELTGAQLAELVEKDEGEKAYQAALLLLGFRKRSKKEMEERLVRRGFGNDTVAKTIQRLEDQGLIDDKLFTEFWKYNRESFKPRGKRLIALELRKAGVAAETIRDGLKDVDEMAGAYRAAASRLKLWAGLDKNVFKKKIAAFLARRGYGWDVIQETAERLWRESST